MVKKIFSCIIFCFITFYTNAQSFGFGFKYSFDKTNSTFIVSGVLSNSPADSAHIQEGDELLSIDNISLKSKSISDVQQLLKRDRVSIEYRKKMQLVKCVLTKSIIDFDIEFANGVSALLENSDSNFKKIITDTIERGSWVEGKSIKSGSSIQLSTKKGNTTINQTSALNPQDRIITANTVLYEGKSNTESEKIFKKYTAQLKYFFGDKANYISIPQKNTFLVSRKDEKGFESSRISLQTLTRNNITNISLVVIGGPLPFCKQVISDTSKVSATTRSLISGIFMAFYNHTEVKDIKGKRLNADGIDSIMYDYYTSKYSFPEATSCKFIYHKFLDSSYSLKMEWPSLIGKEKASKFYSLLTQAINNSLSDRFVYYQPTNKTRGAIDEIEFAPNNYNIMPDQKHTIRITVYYNKPEDKYSFEAVVK